MLNDDKARLWMANVWNMNNCLVRYHECASVNFLSAIKMWTKYDFFFLGGGGFCNNEQLRTG